MSHSTAGSVIQDRLAVQVAALQEDVAAVHRGEPSGVHHARIDCRRLRSVLATFRPMLDREVTDPVRDELRWLAGSLSDARDRYVVGELLHDLLADEPLEYVAGPVGSRVRREYTGETVVPESVDSERYAALVETLEQLVADPPWTDLAEASARKAIRRRVSREVKRVRHRYDALKDAEHRDESLHDVRKAAKRLRYAAETWAPVGGKDAKRVAKAAKRLTSHLGDRQDTVMTRAHLVALARAADAAGEATFTYGRLHEREARRAADLDAALPATWRRFTGPAKRSTC